MKIGLTFTGNPEKHQFYVDWLKANDNIQVDKLSAASNSPDDITQYDALVISGGVDIHPSFYDGPLNYKNAPADGWKKERDEFEIAAFKTAIRQSIPVLGICRGLQLINVAQHGTLIQNLGNLNTIHEGTPDKTHLTNIGNGTLLSEIVKEKQTSTNSAHHQAIDKLGDGLIVNATSDEGIIEGIEWKDHTHKPFMLAVQWHPERMFRFDLQDTAASKGIRDRFIEEVKKSKAHKQ
jgi:putative glutamine amidotransferase